MNDLIVTAERLVARKLIQLRQAKDNLEHLRQLEGKHTEIKVIKSRLESLAAQRRKEMTKEEVIAAVYQGHMVHCSREDYKAVREILQEQAGKWIDEKQDVRAMIALKEVKRLDKLFL